MIPTPDSAPTSGARVRLWPSRRADIVDIALAGKLAEVDGVEHGADGRVYVIVSLLGDTAVDLGPMSQLGHRFFFSPEELEVLSSGGSCRVLVAGVDDTNGLGGDAVRRIVEDLRRLDLPPGVRVADFGIRRQDLLRSLEDFDAAVLLRTGAAGETHSGRITDLPRLTTWAEETDPGVAHRCRRIVLVGCGTTDGTEPAERKLVAGAVVSVVDELRDSPAFEEGSTDEG
ncbi:hypothetical protein AB0I53_45055 [Saccharopolyspora sp. NPDC050389]|uniref:hypothetical protein n=1 Tax=Saccharopolyspora sp. NPDC050389 TaxID=3155516 RepID=UPI0033F52D1F